MTKGVKIDELPTFDIEYLFLNIRSRSIGESIDLVITCPDDNETKVNKQIYIDEIQVKTNKDHNPDIKLDDTYTMRLKYPSLDQFIDENFNFDEIKIIVLISFHHVLIWFLVMRKHGKLKIVPKKNYLNL